MLKTQQEKDLWHTIDYNYHSEYEEDDEIVIHCHHIPWRSESKSRTCVGWTSWLSIIGLNKLVKKLDKRLSKRRTSTK